MFISTVSEAFVASPIGKRVCCIVSVPAHAAHRDKGMLCYMSPRVSGSRDTTRSIWSQVVQAFGPNETVEMQRRKWAER